MRVECAIPFKVSKKEARATLSLELSNLLNRKNVIDVNNVCGAGDLSRPEPKHYGEGVKGPFRFSALVHPKCRRLAATAVLSAAHFLEAETAARGSTQSVGSKFGW